MIKAIETRYKGYRFRIRLEARWAVFFDALGVRWEYEPEGFDIDGVRYLPDFRLPDVPCWFEVKPSGPLSETDKKKVMALSSAQNFPVIISGDIPDPASPEAARAQHYFVEGWWSGSPFKRAIPDVQLSIEKFASVDGDVHMICPLCRNVNLHMGAANNIQIDQGWGNYGSLGFPMHCEGGCDWILEFNSHKGCVYPVLKQAHRSADLLLSLAGTEERLSDALRAARAARFEHGEVPA